MKKILLAYHYTINSIFVQSFITIMTIPFYKYQGVGNDFIIIDNRLKKFPKQKTAQIRKMCDRRFGIGADGLILLENAENYDFKMCYYNANGEQSTMCGNGGRCLVSFAQFLKIIERKTTFIAVDGIHYAEIKDKKVSLQMIDVPSVEQFKEYNFVQTGSPHHVQWVEDLEILDVKKIGAKLRYEKYGQEGANINFVIKNKVGGFSIRTYARGVEDETLACGTGATAVALVMHKTKQTNAREIPIKTLGGTLQITFETKGEGYKNIFLHGSTEQVFKGEYPCCDK